MHHPEMEKNDSLGSTKNGTKMSTRAPSHSAAYGARLSLSGSASRSTVPCSGREYLRTWWCRFQIRRCCTPVPPKQKKHQRGSSLVLGSPQQRTEPQIQLRHRSG